MSLTQSAIWLSRALRWALGGFFVWLAYQYEDAKPLYFFGAVLFATGFLRPGRCIAGACDAPADTQNKLEQLVIFEEVE